MIKLKDYQEKAVDALMESALLLLQKSRARHNMVFKAPTGAGKTVMMAAFMNRLTEELPQRFDLPIAKRQVAFVWVAPNQLHLQSYMAVKGYFDALRSIKPIHFEDIAAGCLHPGEALFINWQSINKAGNLYIKETEQQKDLIHCLNKTRLQDTEIIVILDEAHYFAGAPKSQDLLSKIFGKIEMDVSATPSFKSDYGHTIHREPVVEAEMIKRNVVLNPAIAGEMQAGDSLNIFLLNQALQKREELARAYREAGSPVSPLLLIQLPNDTQKETEADNKIIEVVKYYLNNQKGISTANNKLAVWLSNEKSNLEGIENFGAIPEVLLFKQGISLGWDCPRAAVLLIFREIQKTSFGVQTVGRILRMPEQKHYADARLNNGYVYTNLSKNIIEIVADDMDYLVYNEANRMEGYQEVKLESAQVNTRISRNRLGGDFKKYFYQAAEKYLGVSTDLDVTGPHGGPSVYNHGKLAEKLVETNVQKIRIRIPKDVSIEVKVGTTSVDNEQMEEFVKTTTELSILFKHFCWHNLGGFAPVDSTPVLEMAIIDFFELYLSLDNFTANKIVLYDQNRPQFIKLIEYALQLYTEFLQKKAADSTKTISKGVWDVPLKRVYNELYQERPVETHALKPFFEQTNASAPEKNFVAFLEQNSGHLHWWYKNGEKNKEDFAVVYESAGKTMKTFYVDFVIMLSTGVLALFDTKTPGSDPECCHKHNALVGYLEAERAKGRKVIGGVIMPIAKGNDTVWKYCQNRIDSDRNTVGWQIFLPGDLSV